MIDRLVLTEDIVIPAGTEFTVSPRGRQYVQLHHEALVDLGPDCAATFTVFAPDAVRGMFIPADDESEGE